jgi:transposase-like protein
MARRKPRRPARPREQWIDIVRGFEASGLSQPEYAEQCGVGADALRYWVGKLRHEMQVSSLAPVPQIEFVEVLADGGAHRRDGGRLTVRVDDLSMEFESTPSPSWMVELVRGLRRRVTC